MSIHIQPPRKTRLRVLISGAGIAGPTLAYWLDRNGFEVTVVERAPGIRSGGYPIDIRGTATEVVARMGLRRDIEAEHIATRGLTFVDAEGKAIGMMPMYDLTGNGAGRDFELPRGALTALLYRRTIGSSVRYRFNDSIALLEDDGTGVNVTFKNGERLAYHLVIGADGIHSNTRRLVFGPEEPFTRYLGASFNIFSVPNDLGLSHEAIVYADVGRAAGVYAVGDSSDLFAFLTFATETPPISAHADRTTQVERTVNMFAGCGWQVPRLIDVLRRADDLYFDAVSQIRMPCWSTGRVALIGDAAYAPSFRSGQGTSLALVGAYVLAGELAAHHDPSDAFVAYERIVRPFVEANQALALEPEDFLLPRTQQELEDRNRMLAAFEPVRSGHNAQPVHSALTLPKYS
jgi:2-polyprenyl-6-methoxyphenol hydroxylase-like FAD-dependent oxidoreductase